MSFNKITIVGYLGRDPEIRYTPQGTAVCKLSVATTERRKNVAGQSQEHTIWFRVTVWGRQGELANEYLAKGRQVYIEGRLRLEEYTDREGLTRISPEVTATDIQFLGGNGNRNGSSPPVEAVIENPVPAEETSGIAKGLGPAKKTRSSRGSKRGPGAAGVGDGLATVPEDIPADGVIDDLPF